MSPAKDDPEGPYPTKEEFAADPELALEHFPLTEEYISAKHWIMSLSNKLAITDVDLKGKRVLIRVGYLSTLVFT